MSIPYKLVCYNCVLLYADASVRAILSVPKGADDFIQGWLDTVRNLSLSNVVCSFINNIGNIWQIQSSYNVYTGTCVLNKAIYCFFKFHSTVI